MKGQFLVLTAKRGKGEYQGKPYAYCKFTVLSEEIANDDTKGWVITDYKGTYEMFAKLVTIPGMYEMDISIRPNAVVVNDIKFIGFAQMQYQEAKPGEKVTPDKTA
jgi:hypothetical protein